MQTNFDPYHEWLGIAPDEQPADYYRLLGLRQFESHPDVINNAADARMGYVRTFQTGRRSLETQRILNELSLARTCLLSPARRAEYDAQLRAKQEAAKPKVQVVASPLPARPIPIPQAVAPPVVLPQPRPLLPPQAGQPTPVQSPPSIWGVDRFQALAAGIRSFWATSRIEGVALPPLWVMLLGGGVMLFLSLLLVMVVVGRFSTTPQREQAEAKKQVVTPEEVPPPIQEVVVAPPVVRPSIIALVAPQPPSLPMPKLLVSPFDAAEATAAQQAWAKYWKTETEITNSVGMKLVLIPPGQFTMGSPASELSYDGTHSADEDQVEVTLTKSYFLGQTEVTQGQWTTVMGTEPWKARQYAKDGTDYPATDASWDDAQKFCQKMNEREGKEYRLPTEAEWEYACRAGTTTAYSFGGDETNLSDYGWWGGFGGTGNAKADHYAYQVGMKMKNPFGLYDMHGNVWEWCEDIYVSELAGGRDPVVSLIGGARRVNRGGGWRNPASYCRSANRDGDAPVHRNFNLGFRVAIAASEKPESPPIQKIVIDPPVVVAPITPPIEKSPETAPLTTPKSLVAPFDAAEAAAAQQAWANYLQTEVQITNSVGMKLVLIPAGQFTMGSPQDEVGRTANEDQEEVTLTKSYFLGQTEVTQGQWKAVMGTEPWKGKTNVNAGTNYPATYVSWKDATEFCMKLTRKEGKSFRLPTEAEWEYACRGGTTTAYSFGPDATNLSDYGWFDKTATTLENKYAHEVGQKKASLFGLYDMHGNVQEWCEDVYAAKLPGGLDPGITVVGSDRVRRGGGWDSGAADCRSANRVRLDLSIRSSSLGFRVAVAASGNSATPPIQKVDIAPPVFVAPVTPHIIKPPETSPFPIPKALVAPFDAAEAQEAQQAWAKYLQTEMQITNSVGMKLVLIPAGQFTMGSPASETGRNASAEEQVEVTVSKSYFLGQTEVTQGQWNTVMGTEPWKGQQYVKEGANYPATYVNWNDATEFCRKVSAKEGKQYRLPTEAEWEYACRGGTTTAYSFGRDEPNLREYGWFDKNSFANGTKYAHEVGQKKENSFGLYDMHGNVFEWCVDKYAAKLLGGRDPVASGVGLFRVYRGGSCFLGAAHCRSAFRFRFVPSDRFFYLGFRVALSSSK